jgi:hypothetical protein
MNREQIEAIEDVVKVLGRAMICTQCYYYKIPRWAKRFKDVKEQCTLGLEPKAGGECMFFKRRCMFFKPEVSK